MDTHFLDGHVPKAHDIHVTAPANVRPKKAHRMLRHASINPIFCRPYCTGKQQDAQIPKKNRWPGYRAHMCSRAKSPCPIPKKRGYVNVCSNSLPFFFLLFKFFLRFLLINFIMILILMGTKRYSPNEFTHIIAMEYFWYIKVKHR
jgi:hypothetical protein